MALTLGLTVATQGNDFSTVVSGFTAGSRRQLVDNENGVFHLADRDDTTMTLTASGADLSALTAPGSASLAIDEQIGFTQPQRSFFVLSIAVAGSVTPPSVTVPAPQTYAVGDTVNVAPPTVNGMTAPLTFALVDARGLSRRAPPAGVTFSTSTGALTGTMTSRQGAYDLAVMVTDAAGRKAVSQAFSLGVAVAPVFVISTVPLNALTSVLTGNLLTSVLSGNYLTSVL